MAAFGEGIGQRHHHPLGAPAAQGWEEDGETSCIHFGASINLNSETIFSKIENQCDIANRASAVSILHDQSNKVTNQMVASIRQENEAHAVAD
jgi:hypothetical protein